MIKTEIISFVKNQLPIDKAERVHDRVLIAVIEDVLKSMYVDLYHAKPRVLDNCTKQYGVTTAIAITQEAGTGIYYSTLPVKIVELPCVNSGVRHIYPIAHTGNQFVPMDSTEADIIFNTDVAVVTSKIGFRTRQDTRVDYFNTNASIRTSGVRMDLLIPFSVYADTDVVHIPELTQAEGGSFRERILTALGAIPKIDLLDNNAETKEDK